MKNLDIREIIQDVKNNSAGNLTTSEIVELVGNLQNDETDFEAGNLRFIHRDEIFDILVEELTSDLYCLGCFTSWALSEATGISASVFDTLKEAEAFEGIGELIMDLDKEKELAKIFIDYDGYGHHFNGCDGSEYEIGNYYYFQIS